MAIKQHLSLAIIENGFSSEHGDALSVSYVDSAGKLCSIEIHLSESGCMVIGKDEDVKYTF